jgi:phage terminase large subunit-like protein
MKIYQLPLVYKGLSTFPKRFPMQAIQDMRKAQGSYVFSGQNLLEPVSEEDQIFRIEWVKYFDKIPTDLKIVIAVDPASSSKKRSDFTAYTVHGWDNKQNWYRLDMYRDKLSIDQRAIKLFDIYKKWQNIAQNKIPILYETVGFQISDKQNIERLQKNYGLHLNIIEMGGGEMHKTSKMDRIRAQQPYFERGEV